MTFKGYSLIFKMQGRRVVLLTLLSWRSESIRCLGSGILSLMNLHLHLHLSQFFFSTFFPLCQGCFSLPSLLCNLNAYKHSISRVVLDHSHMSLLQYWVTFEFPNMIKFLLFCKVNLLCRT